MLIVDCGYLGASVWIRRRLSSSAWNLWVLDVAAFEIHRPVTFSKGLGSVSVDILNRWDITVLGPFLFFEKFNGFALRILEVIINIMRNLDTVSTNRGPVQHLFSRPIHLKVLSGIHGTKRKGIEWVQQPKIIFFRFLLLLILKLKALLLRHIVIQWSVHVWLGPIVLLVSGLLLGIKLQIVIDFWWIVLLFIFIDKLLHTHTHYGVLVNIAGILILNLWLVIFAGFAIRRRVFVAPQFYRKNLQVLLEVENCGILGKFELSFAAEDPLITQM